jgi:hypothetical protein
MLYKKSLFIILSSLIIIFIFPFITAFSLIYSIDINKNYFLNFFEQQVSIPKGTITTGYGEYYVFDLTGSKISKDTY